MGKRGGIHRKIKNFPVNYREICICILSVNDYFSIFFWRDKGATPGAFPGQGCRSVSRTVKTKRNRSVPSSRIEVTPPGPRWPIKSADFYEGHSRSTMTRIAVLSSRAPVLDLRGSRTLIRRPREGCRTGVSSRRGFRVSGGPSESVNMSLSIPRR